MRQNRTVSRAMASLMTLGIAAVMCVTVPFSSVRAAGSYSVNGMPVAKEMQQLMAHFGYGPGNYYVDRFGNYGKSGQPPAGNISGGPVRNWTGQEPRGIANNGYAAAYVNGVTGVRVFWVYSPSIMSGATGGSSGYIHICPNNVYHRSSEGAVNVGGEYNSRYGQNNSWAGTAHTSRNSGRWGIESGPNGPVLALYGADGGAQRVPLATMLQGRWKFNQTKYAVEPGKASCR